MQLDIYQVDAFTQEPLRGNPAAVVPLADWLDDKLMLAIAAENNLSETAFFVRQRDGSCHLRWFTPTREVDLCGHATLASAYVLFEELQPALDEIHFTTLSGELRVKRDGAGFAMEFPSRPAVQWDDGGRIATALRADPEAVLKTELQDAHSDKIVAVFAGSEDVRKLEPDMKALMELEGQGVVVTAPGDTEDFVSRYFVPKVGVPEDPVTGSTHCTLAPYWAERLGKSELHARQLSRRGGELHLRQSGSRVEITGSAVLYLQGRITI